MSDTTRAWGSQRLVAGLVRTVALSAPLVFGCATAVVAAHRLPTSSNAWGAVGRALLVMLLATVAVAAADRLFRRLLPLSMLLRLSLVFPDKAPSRFKTALKAGSSRRLNKIVATARDQGLDADPDRAAEQVLLLIGALGAHDRLTRGHCERVRLYAHLIGEEMGLSPEELQKLQWGALLHDLGKLRVPAEILNKKGAPTEAEWAVLKKHPGDGEQMIQPLVPFLGEWADAAGGHHERWNGTGYPKGRSAGTISRSAAIVAVADSFETMTAVRSYKKPMPLAEARAELTRCAGTQFSPVVVRAFLSLSLGHLRLAMGPLASIAQLPFLGNVAQMPNALNSASTAVGSTASAAGTVVATALVATALTMTPMADLIGNAQSPEALSATRIDTDSTTATHSSTSTPVSNQADVTSSTSSVALPSNTTSVPTNEATSSTDGIDTSPSTTVATTAAPTTTRVSTTVAATSTTAPASTAHAPSALDDAVTARQGTVIHIDVLANDFDIDGDLDPLSVSVMSGPEGPSSDPGDLSVKTRNGRQEIDYRLPFVPGEFSFTYQVCDASGSCGTATVSVAVTP